MARHTKEWNEGYQAAIEAIKKAMQGGGSGDGDGEGLPSDMTPPPGQGGSGNGSGKGKGKQQNSQGGQSGNSRTSSSDPNQGVVRPEDCEGGSGVGDIPGTPGGFFNKEDGDKLAQSEGYDKEGGGQDSVERSWKDAAIKAANGIKEGKPGDVWGKLKSTIEGLYKTTTDWKAAFKFIVGKSLNDAETRSALVNKNILISQDRMARTEKDKYDNMDYMICVVDSSGSMSDDDLKHMLSEIYALAVAKKPMKLYVIQCDTKIQEIKEYNNVEQLKKDALRATVKGRGGTDMGDFFKLMKTDKRFNRSKPDLIIIFTDSDSRGRQYPRDRKTMNWLCWCILDDPGFQLKYADRQTKVIHLKSSDVKR